MAKTARTKLISKIDKLYSERRRQEVGYCQKCGKSTNLQLAHIHSRRNLNLRWNDENTLVLCYACHIHWAHREVVQYVKWIETFKDLELLEHEMSNAKPIKQHELEDIYLRELSKRLPG